jgi:hypothetical protein
LPTRLIKRKGSTKKIKEELYLIFASFRLRRTLSKKMSDYSMDAESMLIKKNDYILHKEKNLAKGNRNRLHVKFKSVYSDMLQASSKCLIDGFRSLSASSPSENS